jgi:hypothetical protein
MGKTDDRKTKTDVMMTKICDNVKMTKSDDMTTKTDDRVKLSLKMGVFFYESTTMELTCVSS